MWVNSSGTQVPVAEATPGVTAEKTPDVTSEKTPGVSTEKTSVGTDSNGPEAPPDSAAAAASAPPATTSVLARIGLSHNIAVCAHTQGAVGGGSGAVHCSYHTQFRAGACFSVGLAHVRSLTDCVYVAGKVNTVDPRIHASFSLKQADLDAMAADNVVLNQGLMKDLCVIYAASAYRRTPPTLLACNTLYFPRCISFERYVLSEQASSYQDYSI